MRKRICVYTYHMLHSPMARPKIHTHKVCMYTITEVYLRKAGDSRFRSDWQCLLTFRDETVIMKPRVFKICVV